MAEKRGPEIDSQAVKNGKGLTIASCVCGPVSLLLGGCLISLVGLILGIVGRSKLSGAEDLSRADFETAAKYHNLSKSAIIICAAALVINVVVLIIYLPDLMAQYGSMLESTGAGMPSAAFGGIGSSGISSNTTWG